MARKVLLDMEFKRMTVKEAEGSHEMSATLAFDENLSVSLTIKGGPADVKAFLKDRGVHKIGDHLDVHVEGTGQQTLQDRKEKEEGW